MDRIVIKGARQNNLKNIDLELPRRRLIVVTGVSGSGKSSLVFDTLYQESRRRFLETLPNYVLQFMERLPRPDCDWIEGISPAVAVEQRNPVNTSRSTVGTLTEILDYLRLIFSRAGTTLCPGCGKTVAPDTPESVGAELLERYPGAQAAITFQPPRSERVIATTLRDSLLALGFIRVYPCDSRDPLRLDDPASADSLDPAAPLYVAVDRLDLAPRNRGRLNEALRAAFHHGEGRLSVILDPEPRPLDYSELYHCARCDRFFPEPTHNLFSFNNSYGACPTCRGFGNLLAYDPARVVPDLSRSLEGGALDPWSKPRYEGRRERLREFCHANGIDMKAPWLELPEEQRNELLYGEGRFDGVFPFLKRLEAKKYKQYIRFFLRSYQSERICTDCSGGRLRPEADNVLFEGRTFGSLMNVGIGDLRLFFARVEECSGPVLQIAGELVREVLLRLDFMREVGLGYLTLGRMTRSLSGGEYQRIMLTRLLGSGLTDTLFVLDEPTIGLHKRDTERLIRVLRSLVERGNTLLVVEHDRAVIESADHILELGPGSGEQGGEVLFNGPADSFRGLDTPTARWLDSPRAALKKKPRAARHFLRLRQARLHNLKDLDVDFPLGCLTCVTGVSGSGKSSLVTGVLHPALEAVFAPSAAAAPPDCAGLENQHLLSGVSLIDQAPIGRTPRSNPVTYIKAFDEIRKLFATTRQARMLGLAAGDFSFNTAGGRCDRCKGAGQEKIEMQFMADIFVPCEACEGKRFNSRVLRVEYNGATIDRVLELTVNAAIEFFGAQTKIGKPLWILQSVGLGYLRLGQSATTLSGGESQRLKIARHLAEGARGARGRGRMYILDEPTTGLHHQEILKLMRVLERLVEAGHSVVVIEHNPEVIAAADWIVDLGPEGGAGGGELVVQGTPKAVAACARSHTGALLRDLPGADDGFNLDRFDSEVDPPEIL